MKFMVKTNDGDTAACVSLDHRGRINDLTVLRAHFGMRKNQFLREFRVGRTFQYRIRGRILSGFCTMGAEALARIHAEKMPHSGVRWL